jgi:Kef-type K+ transport system membrane component KefB
VDLGPVALILAAGLLGPALSLLARGLVPVVVGELVAGLILGKTGLRVIDPARSDLSLLYALGFATLMFGVGMQVPLRDRRVRGALGRGAVACAVAVPLAVGSGYLAHRLGGGPVAMYAVVIVSSSAAIALPVIDESRLDSPAILAAMAWITIADILATIAIPLAIKPSRAGHAALGALIIIVLVAVVFVVARLLRRREEVKRIRQEGKRRRWAIDLRLALLVLVSLAFLAQKVGASLLVAGFGTGLVAGAIGGPKRLSQEVLGLGQGFLVPLFFVLLGAKLDLRALSNGHGALVLALALSGLAVLVHILAGLAIRAPVAVGLLASAQIGVPAAVIALGLPAHAINQGQASAIFCAALVSIGACTVGAAVLRRGQGKGRAGGSDPPGAPDVSPAPAAKASLDPS